MITDSEDTLLGYIPRRRNAVLAGLMDGGRHAYGIVSDMRYHYGEPEVMIDVAIEDA